MNINQFLSITNKRMEQYNIQFIYDVADGIEIKGSENYKFVEFNYDLESNQFCFTLKKINIVNSMSSIKCIQEIALAGEIIEILNSLANK